MAEFEIQIFCWAVRQSQSVQSLAIVFVGYTLYFETMIVKVDRVQNKVVIGSWTLRKAGEYGYEFSVTVYSQSMLSHQYLETFCRLESEANGEPVKKTIWSAVLERESVGV